MTLESLDRLGSKVRLRVARLVAGASEERLGRLDRGVVRRVVLAVIPLALSLRFKHRDARDVAGELELRIPIIDSAGYDPVTIVIDHGRCTVRSGASARPTATLTSSLADLVRSGTGAADLLVLIGQKRVVLSGDAWFALRFPALFGLPTRPLV